MQLYKIAEELNFLSASLELSDDGTLVDKEKLLEQLNETQIKFETKIEHIGKIIRNNEADVKVIDEELNRLSARKKSRENQNKYLKEYALQEMIRVGNERIPTPLFTIFTKKNSIPIVNITAPEKIPHELCDYEPEKWTPSKKLVLEHFNKTGEISDAYEVITNKKHLEIR